MLSRRVSRFAVTIAGGLLLSGCGVLGPGGPTVEVAILEQGLLWTTLVDTARVRASPEEVVVELKEGFSQANYGVRADASQSSHEVLLNVVTHRTDDVVLATPVFRRYRLTVRSVEPGYYRLRLVWRNEFLVPAARVRTLVDTMITIPNRP